MRRWRRWVSLICELVVIAADAGAAVSRRSMTKGMLYVNDIPNFLVDSCNRSGLGVGGARTNPPSVSPLLVETGRDSVGASYAINICV